MQGEFNVMTCFAALALAVLLSLVTGPSTAHARDVDIPLTKKHLALIIANQDYNMDGVLQTGPADIPPPGFLKDLANPCRDAALFQQTLLNAHWQPEEITFASCNQTAPEMRKLIADFREKVANSTDTLAIFYYSGHGAQFSDADTDHGFLFGVGAKLDLVALAASWRNSPKNTSAMANEAVDLDELTGSLGFQTQNAVLIILDACRNNPLYGQINELQNAPSIAALGAPRDFNGIVIAYSTPHGEFSGDGFKDHSIFTAALVEELRPSKNLDSSLNSLRKAVDIAYRQAYPQRTKSQIPVVTGRFSADWCLTECPPQTPAATRAFTNTLPSRQSPTETEVPQTAPYIDQAPLLLSSFHTSLRSSAAHISLAATETSPTNAIQQIAPTVQSRETPASQASGFTQTIYDRNANKQDFSLPAQPGMHFDVFWCDGGDGSADREKRALDIASALGKEASALETASLPITDSNGLQIKQSITSVRLRRLTTIANTGSGFRYSDDVIVYDKNDANEAAWTKVVSKLTDSDLNQDGGSANTPKYMSIFVCRAPKPEKQAKTLIYLQVPNDNLKSAGHLLLKDLSHLVPTVKDAGGIETRSDGPLSTEVRFYNDGERDSAFATAKAMEQVLGEPVKVQFIPRLANAGTIGHMEIWIGRTDPVLDKNALKAIPPKKDSKE
jgi:hypothetical protein